MSEGPRLERLLRRLAECPGELLAEPRTARGGAVRVDAVVFDTLWHVSGQAPGAEDVRPFGRDAGAADRDWLRLVLVASWLLHDAGFRGGASLDESLALLTDGLRPLATMVPAPRFVEEDERREELARLALDALGLRPAGESEAVARDRLAALSTVGRERVLREMQAAMRRAAEVRAALARKQAEEAAAKGMPE